MTKMVSYPQTGLKIPVRPAPAPPSNGQNRTCQRNSSKLNNFDKGNNDPFLHSGIIKSFASHKDGMPFAKKQPPPRPPPPKFSDRNHIREETSVRSLAGLFSRSGSHNSTNITSKSSTTRELNSNVTSLIDWDSPAPSPSFTAHSSSDGISVNSFGSDDSVSNNLQSSVNPSLLESGFEDDFSFFSGISDNTMKVMANESKNPWSILSQEPQKTQTMVNIGAQSTNLFDNIASTTSLQKSSIPASKPTIIRAKPNRPPSLPLALTKNQYSKEVKIKGSADVFVKKSNENTTAAVATTTIATTMTTCTATSASLFKDFEIFSSFNNGEDTRDSPPMPSGPPPPPPENISEELNIVFDKLPDLPPRNPTLNKKKTPYGIAQFEYTGTHPEDLSFKVNEYITLLRKINDEWLYGQIKNRKGMFPANFIKIIIPLENDHSAVPMVRALYSFTAQQWDDLDFPEGAMIKVIRKVNNDWLYGEFSGKRGQFPTSFVEPVNMHS